MRNTLIIFLIIAVSSIKGQVRNLGVQENRMLIQSQSFKAHTDHSSMILDIANGNFYLSFDVATLVTGDPKLDSTLAAIGQQIVVYKGNINENIFRFNQQMDDENQYNMPGFFVSNGTEVPCIAQYDPISLADKGDVKNYRMDFKLVVDAAKVKINGLENKLIKDVVFEIMGGRLNVQP